jgi:hypothetical protein
MPYVRRNYLVEPAESPVWRYMNLEKLLSILLITRCFLHLEALLPAMTSTKGS